MDARFGILKNTIFMLQLIRLSFDLYSMKWYTDILIYLYTKNKSFPASSKLIVKYKFGKLILKGGIWLQQAPISDEHGVNVTQTKSK